MREQEIILRQYEKYVDSIEKVSDRRQITNNFFLSLNPILLGFTGFLTTKSLVFWHIVLVFSGISISLLWFLTITSFRKLNRGKFKVVHDVEKKLPVKLFDDEWDKLGRGKDPLKYIKISFIEQGVPLVFLFLHLSILIAMLF